MLAALLITLREGLEAALIVGIILSALQRLDKDKLRRWVWWGVLAAIVTSMASAVALNALGLAFEGRGEEIFEGVAMLIAAGVLTWVIIWMQQQGAQVRARLEQDVRRASASGSRWALFGLAFVAVVREGIEITLFLTAAALNSTAAQTLAGGALGLIIAVILGWLIFAAGRRLNVRAFFRTTSVILLFFAAGLAAHGVHELQEAALLPIFVEHVWDLNPILDENGTLGSFLATLFGYNGNPSFLEITVYGAYLLIVGVLTQPFSSKRTQKVRLNAT